ncbi:hypothetical protein ATN81_18850 [Agrobacterium pusense]|uniref:HNH endonuclease signature motif containing protein n=1 Tax=Agrobacterium pusense TaxID=648995 RepID=UPI00092BEF96|nr:HNH endonuclease signature motif containing protein [Agrobacterium pusense]OJH53454.1 hypothetical protein ATN81_18850 [Agrobacterium pusense]OJH57763.1 hypothetical protein BA725_20755 [Agrobacterium pusense]
MTISAERLREILLYDPGTGLFTWRKTMGRNVAGSTAGTLRSDGYIRIQIEGERKYAAHWAWLYMTGKLPDDEVDHEDRNRSNNAWSNLRPATKSQNCANRVVLRGDLPRGVGRRGKKFVAMIRVRGETRYLGIHDTPEQAHEAYLKEAVAAFGSYSFEAANDNGQVRAVA